ncbi:MAG: 50S ribosomal protein L21 [Alphaproteobacteria bacterium]|jgi:large subunit ribosomal protein L21|nr:50S ribosomal protein L21 [Alphaproteobacteria bacterium]
MLAVIKLAGTQYMVKKNDVIKVNKLNSSVGEEFEIKDVLSLVDGADVKLGTPTLENVVVRAKIIEQGRDKKVIVFKKRRRKHHKRKNGHRQYISMVEIIDIK